MKRLFHSSIAIAALAGFLLAADVAEAQRIRSPIERRLRPGQGFWSNGSSSQVRSHNGYSSGSSYSAPRHYAAPQHTSPRYTSPQYVMPHRTYVPQQYAAPSRYYYPHPQGYVINP